MLAALPILLADPVLGWVLEPGARADYGQVSDGRATGRVTINSLGHRSPEPDGRPFDVLLVGDSFAFGALVDDAEAPAGQFLALGARGYSLGVGGYAPVQEAEALRRAFAAGLRAARVVWCLYENDAMWPGAWENRRVLADPSGRFLGAEFPGVAAPPDAVAALAVSHVVQGAELASAHGASFRVLVLPSKVELGYGQLLPHTRAMAVGARRLGLSVDVLTVEPTDFWSWDAHYTAAGYRKVALAALRR